MFLGVAQSSLAAEALCADSAQTASVRAAFAKPTPPLPFVLSRELKIPEALVVSALPPEQAYGTSATHFQAVWTSLQKWDKSVFVVMKDGHVFETHGKVLGGEPSKRSNFFNLQSDAPGMSGHLRPDLLSTIYAVAIAGKESVTRGVIFFNQGGEAAFSVYVPSEGETPSARLVQQFESTLKEIRSLPAVCAPRAP
jgi:putative heme iron utilization protein